MNPETVALGLVWYVAFLFSTTCHEASHALAAKLGGDLTAFHGGQVTLNPVPHIRRSPIGMVVAPLVSYALAGWMMGWANAPFDPAWEQRYPRRSAWMALAGPGANFTIMIAAGIAMRVGMAMGHFQAQARVSFSHVVETASGGESLATIFLSVLFVLNLLLGTFNLMPFPPLDGNTAVTLVMPRRAALAFIDWSRHSGYGMLGLLAAYYLYRELFSALFGVALRGLYPGMDYH
jgi:Zn-dependent protease